jgi:hypothetical protein
MNQAYTCPQLAQEAQAVSTRAASLSGVQDQKRTNDGLATAATVVIFRPAAFFCGRRQADSRRVGTDEGADGRNRAGRRQREKVRDPISGTAAAEDMNVSPWRPVDFPWTLFTLRSVLAPDNGLGEVRRRCL